MKIVSEQIQFSAAHSSFSSQQSSERLHAWVGNSPAASRPSEVVRISEQARQAQQAQPTITSNDAQPAAIKDEPSPSSKDPKLALLLTMVEMMLKRKIRLFDPKELQTETALSLPSHAAPANKENSATNNNSAAGFGLEYDYQQTRIESEQTRFSAQGTINTSDGQSLQFSLSLEMSRSFVEQSSLSVRMGDAVVAKDPLILNFNGSAAQLSDQTFNFDLNNNGGSQAIPLLSSNSGFLAIDKNGNGDIDNGSELFGPSSGNGFQELSQYDHDHNGWIDENDPAFSSLKIWRKQRDGSANLSSLQDNQVGALYLGRIDTPFALKDSSNKLQALVKETGLFVQEDGQMGTLQRLDIVS